MKFIVFILLILTLTQADQLSNKEEIKIQDQALEKTQEQNLASLSIQAETQVLQDPVGDMFLGEDGEGTGLQARAMHKILFGVDKNQRYSYDVEFVHIFQSYFPIFEAGQENSDLNKFTYKYVFLYADHLSVFKDEKQMDPPQLLSDIKKKVGQKEFLNNYPINIFLTPCNGQICTVGQFKKYYDKLNPQQPFQIEPKVSRALGPDAENNCFLLIKDLIVPKEYFYLCSERVDVLLHMKFAIEEAQGHLPMNEQSSQVSYILPSKNDIIKIFLHLDKDRLVGNNRPESIEQGKKEKDYFKYFEYSIHDGFFTPAAEPISLRRGNEVEWKGDQALKPDKARCIELNLKFKDKKDESVFLGHEQICFYSSSDGSRPVDLNFARVMADQWSQKINKESALATLGKQEIISICLIFVNYFLTYFII